ncbi:MAG: hypothetical protein BWY51_00656 [Parcubacteria group bacterium ADurb.Bin316]|nr:MAG: hypothetical protein BWY51_00656 [Parcubacteria group bacterium ADurb.Bin316]HOZ56190.1 hypothetical protein [bacterium]
MSEKINQFFFDYFNQIINSEVIGRYLDYVGNLSSRDVLILVVVTAVLILIMAYRKLGIGAVFGLCLIYFFIYVIFYSNIFDNWQKEKMEEQRRMQIYNVELQK